MDCEMKNCILSLEGVFVKNKKSYEELWLQKQSFRFLKRYFKLSKCLAKQTHSKAKQ